MRNFLTLRKWLLIVLVACGLLLLSWRLEKPGSGPSSHEETAEAVSEGKDRKLPQGTAQRDRKLPPKTAQRDRHPIQAEKHPPMPRRRFQNRNTDTTFVKLKWKGEQQIDNHENDSLSDETNEDVAGDLSDLPDSARGQSMKTIIWYDFFHDGHGIRNHARDMDFSTCKNSNCRIEFVIMDDNSNLKTTLDGDAVLFQLNRISKLPPPLKRDADQVFVAVEREAVPLASLESAKRSVIGKLWSNMINWTMTYRLDSDIPYIYSSIHQRETENAGPTKDYDKIFNEKSKTSAWLVSHCLTRSRRMDYIKELQEVIDVDILGECGRTDVCPRHNADCLLELARQYKFYLAFENTFHTDYVTEKFYNWYQRDVITVVRGGADYSKLTRTDTYINARDFASPAELGHFLNELGQDKARYIEYLERKDQYYVLGQQVQTHNAYCVLCEWLHSVSSHRKSYPQILKWWVQGYFNFKNDKDGKWRDF